MSGRGVLNRRSCQISVNITELSAALHNNAIRSFLLSQLYFVSYCFISLFYVNRLSVSDIFLLTQSCFSLIHCLISLSFILFSLCLFQCVFVTLRLSSLSLRASLSQFLPLSTMFSLFPNDNAWHLQQNSVYACFTALRLLIYLITEFNSYCFI